MQIFPETKIYEFKQKLILYRWWDSPAEQSGPSSHCSPWPCPHTNSLIYVYVVFAGGSTWYVAAFPLGPIRGLKSKHALTLWFTAATSSVKGLGRGCALGRIVIQY